MKQENNTQDKLKSCPFCGSRDVKVMGITHYYDEGECLEDINPETGIKDNDRYFTNYLCGYAIYCDNCDCRLDMDGGLTYPEEEHIRLSAINDLIDKWNSRVDDEPYKKLFDLMVLYLALRDGVCSPIQRDVSNKGNINSSGCTKVLPPNKLTDMLSAYMTGGCKE